MYDRDTLYEYFWTTMNMCYYYRDHLAISEVISLFAERILFESWMVPTCDTCSNPEICPCDHCLELNCMCEMIRNNTE